MQIVSLYRYVRPGGGVTVSVTKPDVEYTEMFRLVADEGAILVNGDIKTSCIDTADFSAWVEVVDDTMRNDSVME